MGMEITENLTFGAKQCKLNNFEWEWRIFLGRQQHVKAGNFSVIGRNRALAWLMLKVDPAGFYGNEKWGRKLRRIWNRGRERCCWPNESLNGSQIETYFWGRKSGKEWYGQSGLVKGLKRVGFRVGGRKVLLYSRFDWEGFVEVSSWNSDFSILFPGEKKKKNISRETFDLSFCGFWSSLWSSLDQTTLGSYGSTSSRKVGSKGSPPGVPMSWILSFILVDSIEL